MDNLENFDPINGEVANNGEGIVFVLDEHRTPAMCYDRGNDTNIMLGMFQVVVVTERHSQPAKRDGMVTKLASSTTMMFVLAESESAAIGQVAGAALSHENEHGSTADERLKDGTMTATATRIPLHIRGWGHKTF